MTNIRFSDLPPSAKIAAGDIFAVTQNDNGVLRSRSVSAAELAAYFKGVIHVAAGESVDALTAESGLYIFELRSTLINGPSAGITSMRHARLEVIERGRIAKLSAWGHFQQTSGYMHAGCWELYIPSDNGAGISEPIWSVTGPGDSSNPQASKTFTMVQETLLGATIPEGIK